MLTHPIFVALGSNLPDRSGRSSLDLCRWAIATIAGRSDVKLIAVSTWYRTRPIPAADQPDYVNGVAHLTTALDPPDLLCLLHEIEAQAGRVRSVPNAARILDLDLLAFGNRIIQTPTLIVPHPRLHERSFVLRPLADIAPEWRHPILGQTARELRDVLPGQGVERLET